MKRRSLFASLAGLFVARKAVASPPRIAATVPERHELKGSPWSRAVSDADDGLVALVDNQGFPMMCSPGTARNLISAGVAKLPRS